MQSLLPLFCCPVVGKASLCQGQIFFTRDRTIYRETPEAMAERKAEERAYCAANPEICRAYRERRMAPRPAAHRRSSLGNRSRIIPLQEHIWM